jgi:hypothetical protein
MAPAMRAISAIAENVRRRNFICSAEYPHVAVERAGRATPSAPVR